MRLEQFDLPGEFIRRFHPVKTAAYERGLCRYLFDPYRLEFFRSMTTADRLLPNSVWTVRATCDRAMLVAGEQANATHYVVTEFPRDETSKSVWALPRRETLRQKIRRATIETLLADLRSAPFSVADEVVAMLTERLNGIDL